MRYLLDECLSELTARTMDVLGAQHHFAHLLSVAPARTEDDDIPRICQANEFGCLISLNVKDFGARKRILQAVVAAGVHVLVLRGQPRKKTSTYWQVSLLARYFQTYTKVFAESTQTTLAVLNEGGVRILTLEQIVAEIAAHEAGRPAIP